jgi:hypothetical protein
VRYGAAVSLAQTTCTATYLQKAHVRLHLGALEHTQRDHAVTVSNSTCFGVPQHTCVARSPASSFRSTSKKAGIRCFMAPRKLMSRAACQPSSHIGQLISTHRMARRYGQ